MGSLPETSSICVLFWFLVVVLFFLFWLKAVQVGPGAVLSLGRTKGLAATLGTSMARSTCRLDTDLQQQSNKGAGQTQSVVHIS